MSSSSEDGDDIFASDRILQKQLDIAGQSKIPFPKSKKTQKSPKFTIRRRHSSTFITPPDGPDERRQARLIKQYKIDLINSDKAVNRRIARRRRAPVGISAVMMSPPITKPTIKVKEVNEPSTSAVNSVDQITATKSYSSETTPNLPPVRRPARRFDVAVQRQPAVTQESQPSCSYAHQRKRSRRGANFSALQVLDDERAHRKMVENTFDVDEEELSEEDDD